MSCFFFFQAEDGIRDTSVTGVQTCALPILDGEDRNVTLEPGITVAIPAHRKHGFRALGDKPLVTLRSEERRVGKDWLGRWRSEHSDEENEALSRYKGYLGRAEQEFHTEKCV